MSEALTTTPEIIKNITEFIEERFLYGAVPSTFGDSTSLMESGIIDSMGILELAEHLESNYAINIADDEFIPDNLDTLANIARYIRSKKAPTAN